MQESSTERYFFKKQKEKFAGLARSREEDLDLLSNKFIEPLEDLEDGEGTSQPNQAAASVERRAIDADRIVEIKKQLGHMPDHQLIRAGVYPIRKPAHELHWLREERKRASRLPWIDHNDKRELDLRIRDLEKHVATDEAKRRNALFATAPVRSPEQQLVWLQSERSRLSRFPWADRDEKRIMDEQIQALQSQRPLPPRPEVQLATQKNPNTALARLRNSKIGKVAAGMLAAVGLFTAAAQERALDAKEPEAAEQVEDDEGDTIKKIVMETNYVFDRAIGIPDMDDAVTLSTAEGEQEVERSEIQRYANDVLSSALGEGAAFAYDGISETCAVLDDSGEPMLNENDQAERPLLDAQLVDLVYGDQLMQFSGYPKYDRLLTLASGMNKDERTFVRNVLHGSIVHFPSIGFAEGPSVRKAIWEGQERIPSTYQDEKSQFYRHQLEGAIRFALMIYRSADVEKRSSDEQRKIRTRVQEFIRSQIALGVLWQVVGSEISEVQNSYIRTALLEGTADAATGKSFKPHIQELNERAGAVLDQLDDFTLLARSYQLQAVADDTSRMEYEKRGALFDEANKRAPKEKQFWEALGAETAVYRQASRQNHSAQTTDDRT